MLSFQLPAPLRSKKLQCQRGAVKLCKATLNLSMSKKAGRIKRKSEGKGVKVKDKCILRYKNTYSRYTYTKGGWAV